MKKMIRVFYAPFLICMLVLLVSFSNVAARQFLVVKIVNYTNNPVSVAFARENGYNTADNTTKGWYTVQGRAEKSFNIFNYNPDDNYYYVVQYKNGNMSNGKDLFGWVAFGRPFTSKNGRKLGGGSRVGFKYLNNNKIGRAVLNIGKH